MTCLEDETIEMLLNWRAEREAAALAAEVELGPTGYILDPVPSEQGAQAR